MAAFAAILLALIWFGPLPRLSHTSFAAHMTMHMGVVAIAAPLLSLGVAGGRFDPVRRASRVFSPLLASLVELVVVWAFHAPALHHLARHASGMRVIEQGMFLASGLFLWLSIFGGSAARREERLGEGVLALLLTSMHMTLLGALIALPNRVLFAHESSGAGASALEDQQLGGAIMLLVGGVVYLTGGLWLSARLLRAPAIASARRRP